MRTPPRPLATLSALAIGAATVLSAPAATAAEPTRPAIGEVRWTGEAGGDLGYGASRESCDVNGDGRSDTVVGDWWWDRANYANAGAAYVLLGTDDPAGGEIGAGTQVGAVRIDGASIVNGYAGMSVSCLPDVNGDGIDDLAVGSNRNQKVWVVLGARDFSSVDLDTLGTRGFLVTSSAAVANDDAGGSSNFGYWVSGLGDVNGDGIDDFAITDNLYDTTTSNAGRVWVIAGADSVATVDVDTPAGASRVLMTITGSGGQIVSAEDIGDVNGDGLADVAAGSYAATPWGSSVAVAGAAYAVFGSRGQQSVDVATLGDRGFAVWGPQRARDRLGTAVAALGDVNGDGLSDFVVGGDGVTNAATGARNGGAAVVLGSASTQTVFTAPGASSAVYHCADETTNTTGSCTGATVNRGYWIDGAAADDKLGWSAAGLPDVNGDDVPEVVLGAWGHDSAGSSAGAVYVVYGDADATGTISLASLTDETGFRIDGARAGAQLGRSVGGVEDFDGNGVADVLGGANGTDYASVFLLGPARTMTTLSAGDLTVLGGGTLTASVAAVRTAAGPVSAGTVTFTEAGRAIEDCTDVAVAAGTATCTIDGFATGGEHTFAATFEDAGAAFAASSADPIEVDLAKLAPTVTLGGEATGYAGDEIEFTASLPADNLGGTVTFLAGDTVLGTAEVEDGTARLTHVPERAGTFLLTARYDGDDRYRVGASKARRVTIDRVVPALSAPRLSTARVVYGSRPTVSVTVAGATDGTVVFTAAGAELGTAEVGPGGVATLVLPRLRAGTYRVSAEYLGTDAFAAAGPRTATGSLVVAKASVGSATISAKKARKKTRPFVTVRFGRLNNGAYPTGRVRVQFGGRATTVTLRASDKGALRVRAPKRLTKTVVVRASYLGDANTNAKATPKKRLVVR